MKVKYLYLAVAICMFAVSACKQKDQSQGNTVKEDIDQMLRPLYDVTAEDTATVLSQVNQFLDCLKGERYDEAVDMLYYYDGEKMVKLPEERASIQKSLFKRLHGKRYELMNLRFKKETDNLVNYSVYFEADSTETKSEPDMTFALNPIKMDNNWYLTVVDNNTDKTGGSELHK